MGRADQVYCWGNRDSRCDADFSTHNSWIHYTPPSFCAPSKILFPFFYRSVPLLFSSLQLCFLLIDPPPAYSVRRSGFTLFTVLLLPCCTVDPIATLNCYSHPSYPLDYPPRHHVCQNFSYICYFTSPPSITSPHPLTRLTLSFVSSDCHQTHSRNIC